MYNYIIIIPALWPQIRLRRFLWGWHYGSYQLIAPPHPRLQWCGLRHNFPESGQNHHINRQSSLSLLFECNFTEPSTNSITHTYSCGSPHTLSQVPGRRSSGWSYGLSLLHWAERRPAGCTGWTRCLHGLWSAAWSGRSLWGMKPVFQCVWRHMRANSPIVSFIIIYNLSTSCFHGSSGFKFELFI